VLDLKEGTVMSRLHRARQRLLGNIDEPAKAPADQITVTLTRKIP
jgi:DNA-directed RNA polymerase specialized sigma24 family protein